MVSYFKFLLFINFIFISVFTSSKSNLPKHSYQDEVSAPHKFKAMPNDLAAMPIIPDGTKIHPYLNSKDALNKSSMPFNLLDGFSKATGVIDAGVTSTIHMLPYVTMSTQVLEGDVTAKIKTPRNGKVQTVHLTKHDELVLEAGSFVEWINESKEVAIVTYTNSPAYLFEPIVDGVNEDGSPKIVGTVYDDSVMLEYLNTAGKVTRFTWDQLEKVGFDVTQLKLVQEVPSKRDRRNSYKRIKKLLFKKNTP